MSKLTDEFPHASLLINAGYTTMLKVQRASDEDLLAIEHIGKAGLEKIRAASGEVLSGEPGESPNQSEPVLTGETAKCAGPTCGHIIAVTVPPSPCPYCGTL